MNTTRNNLVGALALGLMTLVPSTQYAADASMSTPAQTVPFSVGAEAGTTGFGGNLGWRFLDNFGVGTGFDYFSYTYNGTIKDDYYHARLRLMSEPLNLEVFPWKRGSFRFDLGVLFNEDRIGGSANGKLTIDNDTYTGNLNLEYKPNIISPYFGIGGNVYFDHGHHFSLMGALGVAWQGNGRVSLTGSETSAGGNNAANSTFQGDLAEEKTKVQSYAKDLQFWPVIKVGFTYSF